MAAGLTMQNFHPRMPTRPVLFLPGWGFDGRVLALAEQELPWLSPGGMLDPAELHTALPGWLDSHGIKRFDLVGWSLGANCAFDFARRHPERISSLTLLAPRRQWPRTELEMIRSELRRDPAAFMKSFYRKCFLGSPGAYERFHKTLEDDYLRVLDVALLERGLDYLAGFSFSPPPDCAVRCIHGKRDIIAPHAERLELPDAHYLLLPRAGHAVFLDQEFLRPALRRKNMIRRRFSRAADTYDRHADVQRELTDLLAGLAPDGPARRLLEIGCGTGGYTARLAKKYPGARITAVDFSEEMVRAARSKLRSANIGFICADAEAFLAAAGTGFDLITSNAAMQWFDDLDTAVANIGRCLSRGGIFWGSLFGPQTLYELEQGLRYVLKGKVHVPSSRFLDREELAAVLRGHFPEVRVEEWRTVRRYGSLREMLEHFKNTGTGGWHPGGALLTRGRLAGLDRWFCGNIGEYRATYQAFLVRCGL